MTSSEIRSPPWCPGRAADRYPRVLGVLVAPDLVDPHPFEELLCRSHRNEHTSRTDLNRHEAVPGLPRRRRTGGGRVLSRASARGPLQAPGGGPRRAAGRRGSAGRGWCGSTQGGSRSARVRPPLGPGRQWRRRGRSRRAWRRWSGSGSSSALFSSFFFSFSYRPHGVKPRSARAGPLRGRRSRPGRRRRGSRRARPPMPCRALRERRAGKAGHRQREPQCSDLETPTSTRASAVTM